MSRRQKNERAPHAKQVWRASSPRVKSGWRYVQVQKVYRPDMALHTATVREVSKSGRDLRPDYVHDGVPVSTSFDVACLPDGTMPTPYELVR